MVDPLVHQLVNTFSIHRNTRTHVTAILMQKLFTKYQTRSTCNTKYTHTHHRHPHALATSAPSVRARLGALHRHAARHAVAAGAIGSPLRLCSSWSISDMMPSP